MCGLATNRRFSNTHALPVSAHALEAKQGGSSILYESAIRESVAQLVDRLARGLLAACRPLQLLVGRGRRLAYRRGERAEETHRAASKWWSLRIFPAR